MPSDRLMVSEIIKLSPTAKAIRVGLVGQPFNFLPGQFVMIEIDLEATGKFKVNGDKKRIQRRPFSISSSPLQKDYLEVTVKTTENAFVSDYLVNYLACGETITLTGPFGKFYLDWQETKRSIMLIGAGSGIAPLMSIFRYIYKKEISIKAHIIYSNKTENEILWRDEIEKLSNSPNLSYEFTLTREAWSGTIGRVNKGIILKSGFLLLETDFYLCGPIAFVKNIENILLTELNLPKGNIKKEIYN